MSGIEIERHTQTVFDNYNFEIIMQLIRTYDVIFEVMPKRFFIDTYTGLIADAIGECSK